MEKEIETIIITPEIKVEKLYKTVYILHGYSGNPNRTYKEDIPELLLKSEKFQTIYILPDGNFNSWYVDSNLNQKSQYSTFIGKELVAYIDSNFPTMKNRKWRGILGWSMGGFGALNVGLNYTQNFSIVGSTCGALDLTYFGVNYKNYQVEDVLGPFEKLPSEYLVKSRAEKMKTSEQYYIFDCGTEDEQMIDMNRNFHFLLTKNGVEHSYTESLGKHDTEYWSKALSNQLVLFENYFNNQKL
ncbi:alpha/beta hydrolase [Flavobacterium quisquiliarum]|uniref:Alpha/beta hydrolase n=1 Tax=Flavobacterium quisquiliarum TaxID=1834436 RepID=A0ABV8W377_9FLAO|nr:alpha/beta hydrolase-fold protein [Flavobacterium quisquiliarum]